LTTSPSINVSTFKVPTVIRLIAENDQPMLPTGKVDRKDSCGS